VGFDIFFGKNVKSPPLARPLGLNIDRCIILDDLLNYLYLGLTSINESNALDGFIVSADILLLEDLKQKAEDCLGKNGLITIEDCTPIFLFADRYQCQKLKNHVFQYILQYFTDVYKLKDFQKLDCKHVLALIERTDIVVEREADIYEAILRWLEYNSAERQKMFPQLFSRVRIFSISEDYIQTSLLSDTSLVHCHPSCEQHIKKSVKNYDSGSPVGLRPRKCLDQYCDRAFDHENSWYELPPISFKRLIMAGHR
jgi:hypothetical protein